MARGSDRGAGPARYECNPPQELGRGGIGERTELTGSKGADALVHHLIDARVKIDVNEGTRLTGGPLNAPLPTSRF